MPQLESNELAAEHAHPAMPSNTPYQLVQPGNFDRRRHFYQTVVDKVAHPTLSSFMRLSNKQIAKRYSRLHPNASEQVLLEILSRSSAHLRWAGADLMLTTDDSGHRRWMTIETNSCPSGMKSTPRVDDTMDTGYHRLLRHAFLPLLNSTGMSLSLPNGELAVLFDKNHMEASGYAHALADLTQEPVHLVYVHNILLCRGSSRCGGGCWQPHPICRWRLVRPHQRHK